MGRGFCCGGKQEPEFKDFAQSWEWKVIKCMKSIPLERNALLPYF
jgi:hypothetical protein